MSRLSAAQPQEKPRASGAALDAGTSPAAAPAAAPPSRKARRNAPTDKSVGPRQASKGKKPAIKRERARAKRPRKIHALRMSDPDWPWPLPLCYMRAPVWWQQKVYRETRRFKQSQGITGPDEATRARYRAWREENGY